MNEHTKHFHVMIDSKGRPTVRIPSDSPEMPRDMILDKDELVAELEGLFKRAANVGWQIGRREARNKMREALGIEKL